jgi:hypothetical protein
MLWRLLHAIRPSLADHGGISRLDVRLHTTRHLTPYTGHLGLAYKLELTWKASGIRLLRDTLGKGGMDRTLVDRPRGQSPSVYGSTRGIPKGKFPGMDCLIRAAKGT